MKNMKKLISITLMATLCLTSVGYATKEDTKTKENTKLITLDIATKIALEKNIDLKTYEAQKEKVQANINSYFSSISKNENLYLPGAENALAQVNFGGAQAFMSRDTLERGMVLKTEVIKNSVESSFVTISKLRRETVATEEKYIRELELYKIDVKKQELGTMSKTALEENRLALMELNTTLTNQKIDLDIACGELNKLLKLPNFSEYTVDSYKVDFEPLTWKNEKVEKYIKQIPDYDMNVLNKKGEADFNRNEMNGILAINNGKEPYMSLKADIYIADFSASQLAEESMTAARDKYNNLTQLQSGINTIEQNLNALNLQKNNLEIRYKYGQVAKSEVNRLDQTIKDAKNNLISQQETYMNLRRIFENKYMAGIAMM